MQQYEGEYSGNVHITVWMRQKVNQIKAKTFVRCLTMMCTDPGMTCIYQKDRHKRNFTLILVRSAPTDILKNLLIKNEFLNLIRQFLTLPDYLGFFSCGLDYITYAVIMRNDKINVILLN